MTASTINFSNTVPAAGADQLNVVFQNDGGSSTVNISAQVPEPIAEVVTFTGTSGTLAHTPIKMIGLFKLGQRLTSQGTSPDYSITGAAITLTVAAVSTDIFIAVYIHA
jgi:hypothetical protein